jgi:hypothetical protein
MIKCLAATVRGGRVEVEVPPEWVEGSEVHVSLHLRASLTADSSPVNGAELACTWDLQAEQERAANQRG